MYKSLWSTYEGEIDISHLSSYEVWRNFEGKVIE